MSAGATMKSPEAIGWKFSARWYEARPGTPYHTVAELIAAAICEDRAEPVSDAEVEAALAVVSREARIAMGRDFMRAALEAARKARAK